MNGSGERKPCSVHGGLVVHNAGQLSLIAPKRKPLPVVKLEPNTNLNMPPLSAWTNEGSFSRTYYQPRVNRRFDCFRSIRLANRFIDAVGAADIIAEANTLKKLLLLPFNGKESLSLILHRIGKTVLVDNCEHLHASYHEANERQESLVNFLKSEPLERIGISNASCVDLPAAEYIACMGEDLITESLYSWSVPDQYADGASDGHTEQPGVHSVVDSDIDIDENGLHDPLQHTTFGYPEDQGSQVELDAYGRIWNFYDLNILVDVNLPIFGCKTNPCVTLHPKDMKHRPINFLTGADLYLDQCMCNAPEALLCWHMGGYVKEYEVIRTEDIPRLENAKFDPLIVKNIAENIVSFLHDNVAIEGHTYWLIKDNVDGENEPMLRLWDLTPLCGHLLDDSSIDPFTLSVGMLIYTVARNLMRRSAALRPKRIANAAYRLLNVCLGLIDRIKHPQVIACVHYLLAHLYLSYGHDAIRRSEDDEQEIERNEPMWAYDDRWQQEYGETYGNYAEISVESLTKKHQADMKESKPLKHRPLPNCSSSEDCCKQALEHCYEGLISISLYEDQQKDNNSVNNPANSSLPFINGDCSTIGEDTDITLINDIQSILFIRAASAYRNLANNSFILERYGRTLRFARVGTLCSLAVISLNAGASSNCARRNVATARALLPAMMCHIAEAMGNISRSSISVKAEAEKDLAKCYRDAQLEAMARSFLTSDVTDEYVWAFPSVLSRQSIEQRDIALRAANFALSLVKKNAPISLFPPTASATISQTDLLRRMGNLKNFMSAEYIERLKAFVNKTKHLKPHEKDVPIQLLAVDFGLTESSVGDFSLEALVLKVVNSGVELLNQSVDHFRLANDQINESLVLANVGQIRLLFFYAVVNLSRLDDGYNSEIEKMIAHQTIESYQSALTCISNVKESALPIFESISKDLALIYFNYASRLQDVESKSNAQTYIEVKEYLSRALSAYTLIRDSPRADDRAKNNACRFVAEVNYRLGSLHHHLSDGTLHHKKAKELSTSAESYYLECIKLVNERVKSTRKNVDCSLCECFSAIRAVAEYVFLTPIDLYQANALKKYRKALKTLLWDSLPILSYIRKKTDRAEDSEKILVLSDLRHCKEALDSIFIVGRHILKDVLQHLKNVKKSGDIDAWKDLYRALLTNSSDRDLNCCLTDLISAIVRSSEMRIFV